MFTFLQVRHHCAAPALTQSFGSSYTSSFLLLHPDPRSSHECKCLPQISTLLAINNHTYALHPFRRLCQHRPTLHKSYTLLFLTMHAKRNQTYCHNHTCQTDVRTQPLTHPGGLPYGADEIVLLVAVDYARKDVVRICGGADG